MKGCALVNDHVNTPVIMHLHTEQFLVSVTFKKVQEKLLSR